MNFVNRTAAESVHACYSLCYIGFTLIDLFMQLVLRYSLFSFIRTFYMRT